MFEELEKLCKSVDFLTENETERILEIVNRPFLDDLGAHIIDIVWARPAKDGILLDPFFSRDRTARGGARPYILGSPHPGVWTWVYEHRSPVWLEEIGRYDASRPIHNRADGAEIEADYLDIFEGTDSLIVVPLMWRDSIRGVYSIELPTSGRFRPETLESLLKIAVTVAMVIWKTEAQKENRSQTSDAIRIFEETIRRQNLVLNPFRTGFVARPFGQPYDDVQNCLATYFSRCGIKLEHYVVAPGTGVVLNDMKTRIMESHFAVVDLSALNSNVLIELGMIMASKEKFLLIRERDDVEELPFNIRPHHVFRYELARPALQLKVEDPASGQYDPMERVLETFASQLTDIRSFREAKQWPG